jgi:hypothetical protein
MLKTVFSIEAHACNTLIGRNIFLLASNGTGQVVRSIGCVNTMRPSAR